MTINPVSQYQVNKSRRYYVRGDKEFEQRIRAALKPLDYLIYTPWEQYVADMPHHHILIFSANFNDTAAMQRLATDFTRNGSSLAHKIIYVGQPAFLKREPLLFALEIGAKFTVHGSDKDEQLRQHLKNVMTQDPEQENFNQIAEEIFQNRRWRNKDALQKILNKVEKYNKNSEEVLKLLVAVNEALNKSKQVEFYLKRILQLNPQSLWAANMLGRFYIEHKEVAKGIEVLEKMSQFHELNSERFLELGNAYLNVGEADKARSAFTKGDQLSNGEDGRFQEGLCKASLLDGDKKGALSILKGKPLSLDVISFLNMRAIMAIRLERSDEGLRLYEMAIEGVGGNQICKAKLQFNLGLAFVRTNDLHRAKEHLQSSLTLGGREFRRAERPLQIVNKVLAKQSTAISPELLEVEFDEVGWETV